MSTRDECSRTGNEELIEPSIDMDRIGLFCRLEAKLMQAFSEQTIRALSKHTLIQLFLPNVRSLIKANVLKEIEKNRAVILATASMPAGANALSKTTIDSLLLDFRQVDEEFCSNIFGLPIQLHIHYERVDPIRLLRLQKLSEVALVLLRQHGQSARLRKDIQVVYSQHEFHLHLLKYLLLYAEEVKLLIFSLKVPWLLEFSRVEFSRIIEESMSEVAATLAENASAAVFRKPSIQAT